MVEVEELRRVALFDGLTDEELRSVAESGSERLVRAGEVNGREGEPVEHLYVILSGELRITKQADGGEVVINVYTPGTFFAEVPLLAGTPFLATGRALTDCRLFLIPDAVFRRMLTAYPAFGGKILETMAERVQILQSIATEREKLNSLGTLAAGLAHELNNPASAARRAVGDLRETVTRAKRLAVELGRRLSPAGLEALATLEAEASRRAASPPHLDPFARSEAEDEAASWLEERGIEEAWDLAPTFVGAGLDAGTLAGFAGGLEDEALAGALGWFGATLNLATLAGEVGESVGRISELVRAMKEYSHMDRASAVEVDVREGLESTLKVLGHKLKEGSVEVQREYEEGLPKVCGHGGELNQVWTNLVDNALDAMEGRGRLGVRAASDGDGGVVVEISDTGPGIPNEVQDHIFEPFFTTKGVGDGTGLGLDIVRRIVVEGHGGDVRVDSGSGGTRFRVRLPIESQSGKQNGG
jgi:signal transduction histidine kinase